MQCLDRKLTQAKSLFDFVPGMAFLGGGRPAHMSCYHSLAHPSGSLVKGT